MQTAERKSVCETGVKGISEDSVYSRGGVEHENGPGGEKKQSEQFQNRMCIFLFVLLFHIFLFIFCILS